MRITNCRSCGDYLFWSVTERGKRMPMDLEPTGLGKFVLEDEDDREPKALFRPTDNSPKYQSHFSTCRDAEAWRR